MCATLFQMQTGGMSSTDTFGLSGFSEALVSLVERVSPGVVAVKAAQFRVASGVVLREDILAVTNHTLRRDGSVSVQTSDGRSIAAAVLGREPRLDLAFLKTESGGLTVLPAAQPAALKAGTLAAAVGMTVDVGPSVSLGILGAVGGSRRTWRGGSLDHFLRLDVNLYPSQSGAAVVNAEGQLIGLATPGLLRHSALAVPVVTMSRLLDEILREGRIRHGYLGVGMQPVPIPRGLREKLGDAPESALIVLSVEPDSPAERANMQLGDILVSLDGRPITAVEELQEALRGDVIGRTAKAVVIRGGNVVDVEVTLAERPKKGS
jgi:serine protease Do